MTAGVLYVLGPGSRPPLADVVARAHARGLPVLVDAAGELPPRSNLRDIAGDRGRPRRLQRGQGDPRARRRPASCAAGATWSAPPRCRCSTWTTTTSCGSPRRASSTGSDSRGIPRHGIGRALKVSKEQIAALLTALRLFASGAYDAELPAHRRRLEQIAAALDGLPVACRVTVPADGQSLPLLEIALAEEAVGRTALEVCRALRRGRPPVQVGHGLLHEGKLVINPLHLNDERTAVLARRLRDELAPRRS